VHHIFVNVMEYFFFIALFNKVSMFYKLQGNKLAQFFLLDNSRTLLAESCNCHIFFQ